MKVVGYIRVSTGKQDLSPAAQERQIRAWAERNAAELVAVELDDPISGDPSRELAASYDGARLILTLDLEQRPALAAAVEHCQAGADVLIAAKRDRYFRHPLAMLLLAEVVAPAALGSCDLDVTALGPAGPFVATMYDAAAQYELSQLRWRTTQCMEQLTHEGCRTGGVPYGYADPEAHLPKDKRSRRRELVEVPAEQKAIARIVELARQGFGPTEICQRLTREGHPPRGERWHPNTIRRVLKRQRPSE